MEAPAPEPEEGKRGAPGKSFQDSHLCLFSLQDKVFQMEQLFHEGAPFFLAANTAAHSWLAL